MRFKLIITLRNGAQFSAIYDSEAWFNEVYDSLIGAMGYSEGESKESIIELSRSLTIKASEVVAIEKVYPE